MRIHTNNGSVLDVSERAARKSGVLADSMDHKSDYKARQDLPYLAEVLQFLEEDGKIEVKSTLAPDPDIRRYMGAKEVQFMAQFDASQLNQVLQTCKRLDISKLVQAIYLTFAALTKGGPDFWMLQEPKNIPDSTQMLPTVISWMMRMLDVSDLTKVLPMVPSTRHSAADEPVLNTILLSPALLKSARQDMMAYLVAEQAPLVREKDIPALTEKLRGYVPINLLPALVLCMNSGRLDVARILSTDGDALVAALAQCELTVEETKKLIDKLDPLTPLQVLIFEKNATPNKTEMLGPLERSLSDSNYIKLLRLRTKELMLTRVSLDDTRLLEDVYWKGNNAALKGWATILDGKIPPRSTINAYDWLYVSNLDSKKLPSYLDKVKAPINPTMSATQTLPTDSGLAEAILSNNHAILRKALSRVLLMANLDQLTGDADPFTFSMLMDATAPAMQPLIATSIMQSSNPQNFDVLINKLDGQSYYARQNLLTGILLEAMGPKPKLLDIALSLVPTDFNWNQFFESVRGPYGNVIVDQVNRLFNN